MWGARIVSTEREQRGLHVSEHRSVKCCYIQLFEGEHLLHVWNLQLGSFEALESLLLVAIEFIRELPAPSTDSADFICTSQ